MRRPSYRRRQHLHPSSIEKASVCPVIWQAAGLEMMPNLLFGDNQFFGINHMSEEKARAQAMRFQDKGSIRRSTPPMTRASKRSCVPPMIASTRFAIMCAPIRTDIMITVLSLYAICAQIRERGNRGRHYWRDQEICTGKRSVNAAVRRGMSLASKDIRG